MQSPTNFEEEKFDNYLNEETAHIRAGRAQRLGQPEADVPWSGIALSGGGIRSACLGLGVLQVLAEHNLLKRFDYISTVSGGGYIGTSLQWWWARRRREDKAERQVKFGVKPDDFPYGLSEPSDNSADPNSTSSQARKNLDFLRAHASYLTPGNELTIWSMLIVVLRTVTISLLIWLPLLVSVFAGWHVLDSMFFNNWANSLDLSSPLGTFIPRLWNVTDVTNCENAVICNFYLRAGYAAFLYVFYFALAIFGLVAILYGFLSRAPQDRRTPKTLALIAGSAAVILAAILIWFMRSTVAFDTWVATSLIIAVLFAIITLIWALLEIITPYSLNPSYWLRRNVEKWLGAIFIPSMAYLAIGLVPVTAYYVGQAAEADKLTNAAGSLAGIFSLLSGIASALYSYYVFIRNIIPSFTARIAATAGALIYLYGTLVLSYWLSIALVERPSLISGNVEITRISFCCLALIAVVLAFYGNLNFVGLHRYYRDRLMEAFMPTDGSVSRMRTERSPVADGFSVADLQDSTRADPTDPEDAPAPYLLINTNVILVKDDNPKYATRGGANFLISPLFIGSSATGWQATRTYIERNGPMTLATAMAASGAAASASAGYIGTGITMNPVVAAVMSLLNVRLGVWVGNPAYSTSLSVRRIPTFINPGLWAGVLGRGHRRTNHFIELTDGGHFENLGLYELVRRKLSLILIVDGEADPKISLSSLVSARNRVEQDFGASLVFYEGQGPELLVMHSERGYPADAKFAQSPFIVGRLTYHDGTAGTFIYIKSNVTPDLDFSIAGYLASNPDFPHQSTADQFFSPDQFEAYRNLGAASARTMVDSLKLPITISAPQKIIDEYLKSGPRIHAG